MQNESEKQGGGIAVLGATIIRHPARVGWTCFVVGIRFCRQYPLAVLRLGGLSLLLFLVVGLVPLLGPFAMIILWPHMVLGIGRGAQLIASPDSHHRKPILSLCFDKSWKRLAGLGLLHGVLLIALIVLSFVEITKATLQADWFTTTMLLVGPLLLLAILTLVAVFSAIMIAEWNMPLVKSVMVCSQGVLKNWLPLSIWMLGWIMLNLIIAFFIGLIIVLTSLLTIDGGGNWLLGAWILGISSFIGILVALAFFITLWNDRALDSVSNDF